MAYYGYYGGYGAETAPEMEAEEDKKEMDPVGMALGVVPIVLDFACYYKVNDDSTLTSDDWKMTKNLALGAGVLKAAGMGAYVAGMMVPLLPVALLLNIGNLYYTNKADGDNAATGSTTNICYAASGLGVVLGALKINMAMKKDGDDEEPEEGPVLLVRRLQMKVEGEDPSLVDIITPTKLTPNGTKLDLNNADLLGCTIISPDDITVRRFLVVQTFQIILVEPDSTRLGWGVVTFSATLQDLEIEQDPRDTRSLTIRSNVQKGKTQPLCQQLIFDDNIRSLAARQRLSKGRQRARHLKLQKIATLLDLPANFLQEQHLNPVNTGPVYGQSRARPGHAKISRNGIIQEEPH